MQHPNLNPPIKSVCTGSNSASSSNPVFIVGTYIDEGYDSTRNDYDRWYRKYSDGTIVQGAYREDQAKDATWTVPFVIPFTTTNIQIHITPTLHKKPSGVNGGMAVDTITTTNFTINGDTYIDSTQGYYWEATGK